MGEWVRTVLSWVRTVLGLGMHCFRLSAHCFRFGECTILGWEALILDKWRALFLFLNFSPIVIWAVGGSNC